MVVSQMVSLFLEDRARKGCTLGTVATYRHQFRLFEAWLADRGILKVNQIRERHLEDYLADMRARPNLKWKGRVSPVTIRKRGVGLITLFLFAKQKRLVKQNPARRLSMPRSGQREPKSLSPEQVMELLNVARWEQNTELLRDYVLIVLMLDSGLRLSEVSGLNTVDVDFARGVIHVRHGKFDKERKTVILDETARLLHAYVEMQSAPVCSPAPLFLDETTQRLCTRRIYRAVKRRAKQTSLYNAVSPHRLRHTWLTEYLNAGGNIHTAAMLAGHDFIQTTIGYTRGALLPVQREHRKYSAVRNVPVNEVALRLTGLG